MAARQVSFEKESLYADTVGEVETENKVLVLKRIKQTLHLTAEEKDRKSIEHVVEVYEDPFTGEEYLGTAQGEGIRRAQSRLQGFALGVAEGTHEDRSFHDPEDKP